MTALLLDKVKTWMRRQGGTTELRALVYMDEIFGYFPPHPANPPTKRPLLTLLKQARAQGVGVVLATQNPVDLDYKGLANMGTWMVGTLQTQQDRERLAGGLQGAGLEPKAVEKLLAGTKKRVFLLHDVHRKAPVPPAVALGDVLPARAAHARGDLAAHEGEARRRGRGRRAEGGGRRPPARPCCPRRFRHLYLSKRGGRGRRPPHLLVKYAVRYKGRGRDGRRARVAARRARRRPTPSRRSPSRWTRRPSSPTRRPACATSTCRPGSPPRGPRASRRRSATGSTTSSRSTVFRDPVTKAASRPGETREAFAAPDRRRRGRGGQAAPEAREEAGRPRGARAGGRRPQAGEVARHRHRRC